MNIKIIIYIDLLLLFQKMLLSKLIKFVIYTCGKYSIDESHGLPHSMNVLCYANKIFEEEIYKKPYIEKQERLIYVSAILHDMCDKKYVNEDEGIIQIEDFLKDKLEKYEIDATKKIISTMSYSKVKKNGFPDLNIYQTAYHIVREADLLTAYDFDRSMIYHMKTSNADLKTAYENARHLFMKRVLKHNEDNLFFTDFAKRESIILHNIALKRIWQWNKIIYNIHL